MNILTKISERSPKYIHYFARRALFKTQALPQNNIVMFHGSRSGSTVLGDLLHQHPDIFWDREIFSERRPSNKVLMPLFPKPDKLLEFRLRLANKTLYGFETQFVHLLSMELTVSEYVKKLEAYDFSRFILLERQNYLRLTVSVLLALHQAKWHQSKRSKPKLSKLYINVKDIFPPKEQALVPSLAYLEKFFDTTKQVLSTRQTLHLTYEDDIIPNPLVAYERVCEFLNVPYQAVSIRLSKTNPFPLKSIIINFEEVEQALKGTRFEWMLYH